MFGVIPEYIKEIFSTLGYTDLILLGKSRAEDHLRQMEINGNFTIQMEHRPLFFSLAQYARAILDEQRNLARELVWV